MQTFDFKPLETNYLKLVRLSWIIGLILLTFGPTIALSVAFDFDWLFRIGLYLSILLLFLVLMYAYSARWFKAYRYQLSEVGLKIHKGVFWRQQSIVPRNRVQHIDITTGPLERRYDLAKLVVHTAGTRNATVTLPGLLHEHATDLRQELINANQAEDTV